MWPKGKTIDDAVVIGEEEAGIYRVKGNTNSNLIPSTINHRRLAHVNYKALPIMTKVVTCLPKIQINYEGVCKEYDQGKDTKNPFPRSNSKEKGVLEIVHSDVCGPMSTTH